MPVFVASGSDKKNSGLFLSSMSLNYFTQILGSPISKTKNVQTLFSEYNFQPEDVIFIGDGGGDYQTTMTLKLPFIYLAAMSEWRPSQGEIDAHPKMWVRRDWQEIMEDFNVQE